jgi:hypothetical protein
VIGERLSSKLALLVQTTCLPELLRGSHDVNVDGWYGMVTSIERSFIGDLPVVIMGRIREKNHCECMCDNNSA